jgi:hypothetical protein
MTTVTSNGRPSPLGIPPPQDLNSIKAGLEIELAGYRRTGNKTRARQVKAQLRRINRRLLWQR